MQILPALLIAASVCVPVLSAQIMYVGTYADAKTKGIYAYRFDNKTGKLAPLGLMVETPSPSFVAIHPNGKWLYAVNELNTYEGKSAGSVSAFSIDHGSGKLTLLNTVSSHGAAPCHIAVDHTGKAVLVANYTGGSFASYPVGADGKLGEAASVIQDQGTGINKQRQEGPHGHSVVLTKSNKIVLAADLGTDKVMLFKLDPATAKMIPNDPPSGAIKPGSGPRHLVIAPDQKHVYVLTEMGSSVSTMSFDANTGALKELGVTSALPADFKGQSSGAEIQIDARGRFLYTSNRGHDSIAVFSIDSKTAMPALVQNIGTGGKTPRGFVLDPTGDWLIAGNQDSDTISVFKIDRTTGKLNATDDRADLGKPVSFAFQNWK